MNKKWYRSKTLWTNVLGLAAVVLTVVFAKEEVATELLAAEGSLLVVVNFILRLITDEGLEK